MLFDRRPEFLDAIDSFRFYSRHPISEWTIQNIFLEPLCSWVDGRIYYWDFFPIDRWPAISMPHPPSPIERPANRLDCLIHLTLFNSWLIRQFCPGVKSFYFTLRGTCMSCMGELKRTNFSFDSSALRIDQWNPEELKTLLTSRHELRYWFQSEAEMFL